MRGAAVDSRLDPAAAARPRRARRRRGISRDRAGARRLPRRPPHRAVPRARPGAPDAGWEAAVGQPRYGPNGDAVRGADRRLRRRSTRPEWRRSPRRPGRAGLDRQPDEPWPPGTSPDEDEALRVSSVLAAGDAAAAVPDAATARRIVTRARRSARRLAHLLVLRHAFAPTAFSSLTRAWRPRFLPDDRPAARVARRGTVPDRTSRARLWDAQARWSWLVAIGRARRRLVLGAARIRARRQVATLERAGGVVPGTDPVIAITASGARRQPRGGRDGRGRGSVCPGRGPAAGRDQCRRAGRIVAANAAAHGLMERAPGSLVGRSLIEMFLDLQVEAIARAAFADGRATGEVALAGADGTRIVVHAHRAPGSGTWLILEDVSELRRLQRIRTEFIDNLSHELRTPLTTVSLLAETLARDVAAAGEGVPPRMRDRIVKHRGRDGSPRPDGQRAARPVADRERACARRRWTRSTSARSPRTRQSACACSPSARGSPCRRRSRSPCRRSGATRRASGRCSSTCSTTRSSSAPTGAPSR